MLNKIMTEEFKRQYDRLSNIERAKGLAQELGYWMNYCDGSCVPNPTWEEEMYAFINRLVGTPWPKEVTQAFDEGFNEGHYDT